MRSTLIILIKFFGRLQMGRRLRRLALRIWAFCLFPGRGAVFNGLPIVLKPEKVEIGSNCSINHGVLIQGRHKVIIGNNVTLSPYVMLLDAGLDTKAVLGGESNKDHYSAPIVLEDHVWVGAGAIILAGVKIGRKSIVAAGSVVTKDMPSKSLIAGIPAKVVRKSSE